MDKIWKIWDYCKIVAWQDIVLIQCAKDVSSLKFVELLIHFDSTGGLIQWKKNHFNHEKYNEQHIKEEKVGFRREPSDRHGTRRLSCFVGYRTTGVLYTFHKLLYWQVQCVWILTSRGFISVASFPLDWLSLKCPFLVK